MPKAILEFQLPEEHMEHEMAVFARKYSMFQDEVRGWLRSKLKYGDLTGDQTKILEELEEYLRGSWVELD